MSTIHAADVLSIRQELAQADCAELPPGDGTRFHPSDLARHDVEVIGLAILSPCEGHGDSAVGVLTAGPHNRAEHVGPHDHVAADAKVARCCNSVPAVVAACDGLVGDVLGRVVLALHPLQAGVVHVLSDGVENPEILGLDMQDHLLTILRRRESNSNTA